MQPRDEYLPDPPRGLGYADFRAARARFLARLAGQAEIARLERALSMATVDPPAAASKLNGHRIDEPFAEEQPSHELAGEERLRPVGEQSG